MANASMNPFLFCPDKVNLLGCHQHALVCPTTNNNQACPQLKGRRDGKGGGIVGVGTTSWRSLIWKGFWFELEEFEGVDIQ